MTLRSLTNLATWERLANCAKEMAEPRNHLKHLLAAPDRFKKFSIRAEGMMYDLSCQRMNGHTVELLLELAKERGATERFKSMISGAIVNPTEGRAALHTAARDFSGTPVTVNGIDVTAEMKRIRDEIREFTKDVHDGRVTGSTGKPFRHVVVIGIGGSYLGTEFVATALQHLGDKSIELHFLSNVDIHNFGAVVSKIDPEATLWIIVSKSFTTAETMANANLAMVFMKDRGLEPERHFISITSKGSPGDNPGSNQTFPVLRSFHMFDFIGGRYSVTSAVGGVPLSLYLGYERFEQFLMGANMMDIHAANAQPEENMPLMAALVGIWNSNFLGYPAQAIIPYASFLAKLAPHVQQLYMESNGKSVTLDGEPLDAKSGVIIFGEPGTNAQHSFFQLAHQGMAFPIEFIGVVRPWYEKYRSLSRGVTNHQELWANLLAQPRALAEGRDNEDPHKKFPGNRPSSTILIEDLSPSSVGKLLAFYEARTVYEAFILGINPFDQFGVELGKKLASDIRSRMAMKNSDPNRSFDDLDPSLKFYLEKLFDAET